jgi:hypothetical protein
MGAGGRITLIESLLGLAKSKMFSPLHLKDVYTFTSIIYKKNALG